MNRVFLLLCIFGAGQCYAGFTITAYDDGKACPGGCDAHVVFHPKHNGSPFAFSPHSSMAKPKPCLLGGNCRICLNRKKTSCITTKYRGNGPPTGRFDFTPAFFQKLCSRTRLYSAYKNKCVELQNNMKVLNRRVNCFKHRSRPVCKKIMDQAKKRKQIDDKQYAECRRLGLKRYNKKSPSAQRRAFACAYSARSRVLSNGLRYKPLLDGACRNGEYVGRNGLDCCSADVFRSAMDISECGVYFPKMANKR